MGGGAVAGGVSRSGCVVVAALSVAGPGGQAVWAVPGVQVECGSLYDGWLRPGVSYELAFARGSWLVRGGGLDGCRLLRDGGTAWWLPSAEGRMGLFEDSVYVLSPRAGVVGWDVVRVAGGEQARWQ